jgi:hypothetical protein
MTPTFRCTMMMLRYTGMLVSWQQLKVQNDEDDESFNCPLADYPSQQYNTQKPVVSSTYRPSTTVTAIPQRDTYVAKPQPQQPQYERPAQQNIYNTDYDDALVAQVSKRVCEFKQPANFLGILQLEDDNSYREPIKTQLR